MALEEIHTRLPYDVAHSIVSDMNDIADPCRELLEPEDE